MDARRGSLGVAIGMTLVLLLAACGSDDAESVDSSGEVTPTATGDDEILGGGPYPVADLSIDYENPEADVSFTYRVSCQGDTAAATGEDAGVTAEAACLALAEPAVMERLVDGPPAGLVCTEIYGGADVATITGSIDEQSVAATVNRQDGCGIDDWDNLLQAVLPAPAPL